MKLILISNETNFDGEFNILHQLFELGLETLHLRKPDLNLSEMDFFLSRINSQYLSKIVLHSHFELVEKYNLKGQHFKLNNLNIRSSKLKTLSASCHSYEEVDLAGKSNFNYVFLSPIFNSISKRNYESDFQKDELNFFLRKERSLEIIALSGVDETRIEECKELGFDGVAILGAVWKSENPIESFLKIKNKCLQLEKIY